MTYTDVFWNSFNHDYETSNEEREDKWIKARASIKFRQIKRNYYIYKMKDVQNV